MHTTYTPQPGVVPLEKPDRPPIFVDPRARAPVPKDTTPVAHQTGGALPPQPPEPSLRPEGTWSAGAPLETRLEPTDLLPPIASRDPEFDRAEGSLLAAGHPALAKKYGVIRGTEHVPPERLVFDADGAATSGGARNSPALDPMEAAARVGEPPGDVDSEAPDGEPGPTTKLDEFDLDAFRKAMMRDLLNNPEQRQLIEGRLEPLDVGDLIVHNHIEQRVPVIPGVFEPTFQSMSGEEDLALKRLLLSDSASANLPDRYLLDKYAFMSAAVGLVAINGRPFGDPITDEKGDFSDERFEKKLARLLKLPLHMLASVGINLFWFETRVRALFSALAERRRT